VIYKKQKDYGIMQKNSCKAKPNLHLFFCTLRDLFRFLLVFLSPLLLKGILNFYIMSAQHISQSATHSAVCSCGAPHSGVLVPVSPYAFQRRVRKRFYSWSPQPGVRVYHLACMCSVWVHRSGQRFISSLPF